MAKKSRKARRRARYAPQPVRISRSGRTAAVRAVPKEVDFAKEYHYVVEDLKRIAVTALALLVLLIVLAFVIG